MTKVLGAGFGGSRFGTIRSLRGPGLTLALAVALAGCSPIDTYRSLAGISKNDPDPQTAPFSGNMAEAFTADYPNLATVPPPPTRATSAADREKLTAKLLSDAQSARATPLPTPPGPIVAPALPSPPAFPEGEPRRSTQAAAATPAASPAADGDRSQPARVAEASGEPQGRGRNRPPSGRRTQGEPPEPGPQNSSLQSPALASLPDPEAIRPPPDAPKLSPTSPATLAPLQPPAAAVASSTPEPPPPAPPPTLSPAPPPPAAVAPGAPPPAGKGPAARRPSAGVTLASLDFPGSAATPDSSERELIARIAGLYKQKSDTLRVIGYAGAPAPGSDPLDSYRAALDRAQAVAGLLGEAGIPANRIQTEATPAAGAGRVEIQLLP